MAGSNGRQLYSEFCLNNGLLGQKQKLEVCKCPFYITGLTFSSSTIAGLLRKAALLTFYPTPAAYCLSLKYTTAQQFLRWATVPAQSGPKSGEGAAVPLSVGSWVRSPSNTMWPGPSPASLPSGILIHPTV